MRWSSQQAENDVKKDLSGHVDAGSKSAGWRNTQARPKMMGNRDKTEAPQGIADMLPDWVGYGFLYFVSVIPVLIAGTVIAILFFNSLR